MARREQLILPETGDLAVVEPHAPWLPLAIAAVQTAREQWSPRTQETYLRALAAWEQWCRHFGESEQMPPRAAAVAAFLQWELENGYSRNTVNTRLQALAWADRWARRTPDGKHSAPDLRAHPLISAWRRGARRVLPGPKSARCPTYEELESIVTRIYEHVPGRYSRYRQFLRLRDRAIIVLAYLGALRSNELCALRVGDIQVRGSRLEIAIRRSKTDQQGDGETVVLFAQSYEIFCPVAAWRDWTDAYSPRGKAPAFVRIEEGRQTNAPLQSRGFARMLAARCTQAGVPLFSPHGLRAALATHAKQVGRAEDDIAAHGRWKSRAVMARYIRRGEQWGTDNLTDGLVSNLRSET